MAYLTVDELRIQFENMAKSNHFSIERKFHGEYESTGRNPFILWAGYWECARLHGIIRPESCALDMNLITKE